MLTTPEEKAICEKYGNTDNEGNIHCMECPLFVGGPRNMEYNFHCKANSTYDQATGQWEYDGEYM